MVRSSFVLMLMLMSWVFSLAYASVCAYAYVCAYAQVKTSLNATNVLQFTYERLVPDFIE